MSLNCGIVGLPNVGKSTIFSALTSAPAEAANYPFCTIDPNVGIVNVPDPRLDRIDSLIKAEKKIPAIVEFVDIAGLVKGASQGEGLGNKFLANIREVGLIVHVVRCFDDADIIHVSNKIDPAGDIDTINIELALADLQTVDKRIEKSGRLNKSSDKSIRDEAIKGLELLERLRVGLSDGIAARAMEFTDKEREFVQDLQLITMKKHIYACNVDEAGILEDNSYVKAVKEIAENEDTDVVVLCGKLESEIAALDDDEERAVFLEEAGIAESGLSLLIKNAYHALGLRTFFTAGGTENKAWTFIEGMTAPQTAGVIHTDFEKGFIKAEIYHCDALFEQETEQAIKSAGKLRIEGKEYVVQDGDVIFFKFNV